MKRTFIVLGFSVLFSLLSICVSAQTPPPPPPPNPGNSSPGPVGGNAALGGGLAFLFLMAATYGTYKFIKMQSIAEKE